MAKVTTTSKVTAVTLSPFARIARTVIQSVVAFAAAEPTLVGLVHLNAAQASEFAGITSGLVFVVSAVQNLLEHFNLIPTVGGNDAKAATVTVPVA
jgi:hypothetical protein